MTLLRTLYIRLKAETERTTHLVIKRVTDCSNIANNVTTITIGQNMEYTDKLNGQAKKSNNIKRCFQRRGRFGMRKILDKDKINSVELYCKITPELLNFLATFEQLKTISVTAERYQQDMLKLQKYDKSFKICVHSLQPAITNNKNNNPIYSDDELPEILRSLKKKHTIETITNTTESKYYAVFEENNRYFVRNDNRIVPVWIYNSHGHHQLIYGRGNTFKPILSIFTGEGEGEGEGINEQKQIIIYTEGNKKRYMYCYPLDKFNNNTHNFTPDLSSANPTPVKFTPDLHAKDGHVICIAGNNKYLAICAIEDKNKNNSCVIFVYSFNVNDKKAKLLVRFHVESPPDDSIEFNEENTSLTFKEENNKHFLLCSNGYEYKLNVPVCS